MIDNPIERLQLNTPEYNAQVDALYTAASETMELNLDFVATYHRLGRFTVTSLDLRSMHGELITLEKALKNPLPKNPDWFSADSHIQKVMPYVSGQDDIHEYLYRDGLIIDRKQSSATADWDVNDAVEDELSIQYIEQLTNEIRTWEPTKQAHNIRRGVSFVAAFIINNV